MQTVTDGAIGAIRSVLSGVSDMSQIGTLIAAAVEEQAAATREIARNVIRPPPVPARWHRTFRALQQPRARRDAR